MTKKIILGLTIISLLCIQCKKDNTFLITKNSIGKLNKSTIATDIESVFIQDSIVKGTNAIKLISRTNKIEVFEKGGKHLLSLTPSNDSISTIKNIRVHDSRYITNKGIGLSSSFKDIRDNYTVKKVVTSMNNVVVFLKENDMYFTIDKKELPASLRYSSSTNIEAVQIPDGAKIKYFMIGWE